MSFKKPSHWIDQLTGRTYHELLFIWMGLTVVFTLIYVILSYFPGQGPTELSEQAFGERFFNALYYSIITATSTGYGDIVPLGVSRLFASLQSISSLFVFAMFVTKLVSNRQDITLREVHKLSFEDIYHNVREDLYVVRKDFDHLMEKMTDGAELTDDDWVNLAVGYEQCTSVLQEVPDFYDGVNNLYMIDARREELLQEAIHRTLHRINQLLDTMSRCNIDWISHEMSVSSLRELVDMTMRVTSIWRTKSPYQKQEAFEQILHLNDSIRMRIAEALPAN